MSSTTVNKPKELTPEQKAVLDETFEKAQKAFEVIKDYSQEQVDRLIQAVAWAVANKKTFEKIAVMGVEESGLGDPVNRVGKRMKIRGVLRDALRQKSVGLIEEIPEKGIKKYGKPAGIIASLIPTTNPELTPAVTAIYAIKARDVVIFSPHPRSKGTSNEVVRLMREALEREGAPADILQCLPMVSKTLTTELMARADLVMATGGQDMVRAAYSSGTPAYGVGKGNATVIIDETADVKDAAHNTMLSKTKDFGSGCSADGNLIIHESHYDQMIEQLILEGAYLASTEEREKLRVVIWDEEGHRLPDTVAISPQKLAQAASFSIPEDRKFIMVIGDGVGKGKVFADEKLTTLVTLHKYEGDFENALKVAEGVFENGGIGHSCGIYSFSEEHINRLGEWGPFSRIMVRQPNSIGNAGSFTNGMPQTSSMGCGTWGGNATSENVSLKHYMNTTWVSTPIPEDKPSDEELFGEFYDPELEK
ncbi:aldehyde dehydrogenase family protein [Neobacillus sp. PS3-12]|uniref:aldehyde dehydrogenase family protein n=1 Tax=Neobacillus sp. PS3-12 TaxID=3070677 RepID=UPI0027E1235C|nr:aldehyde dehydrogenase family protein [Neobacillus sp. PS3-12]WML52167.1 aldehyde dehydrogenase family protein [Neobacillus sp. PS3-12]